MMLYHIYFHLFVMKKLLKSNLRNRINYVDIGTNEGNFLNFVNDNFELKKCILF